jgi:threonine dehydrogenase-like Zn-dependent dehydrogenase
MSRMAVMTAYGAPLELREYPVPDPEPGAIVIKISMAGICGSDLHLWRGDSASIPLPAAGRQVGHEGVGVVERLGKGGAKDALGNVVKEGDRIVFAARFPCYCCQLCLEGASNLCVSYPYRPVGEHPYLVGTYADYYYLPARHPVFLVPSDLSDEITAPINCAMSAVAHGLEVANSRPGQSVVVQGAGGLGLTAVALARDLGADKVIVLDRLPQRLALAQKFGADEVINIDEFNTPAARIERVRELTGGIGANLVLELVGSPELLTEGVAMLRNGGTVLEIGMITSKPYMFDASTLTLTGKRIVGSLMYPPSTLGRMVSFLERTHRRLPFGELVSHRFPLADVNQAFAASEWQGDGTEVIRGVLVPN